MAIIKVSDLPVKDTLDDDDRVLTWSEAGGTQMTLGLTFAGYLKTLGGVMTGAIARNGVLAHGLANSSQLVLTGGTSGTAGAGLWLNGGEASEDGLFRLRAEKGGVLKDLVGQGDGSLQWDGNYIITSAGGSIGQLISTSWTTIARNVTDGRLAFMGGTSDQDGAYLTLSGKDRPDFGGCFWLSAKKSADEWKILEGYTDGRLKWDGKNVERVNSIGSNTNGNYIRLDSGLQICWTWKSLNKTVAGGGYNTITWTYPVAFKSTQAVFANSDHDRFNAGSNDYNTTRAIMYYVNDGSNSFTIPGMCMIAIGLWK